jgi:hypothetical protein
MPVVPFKALFSRKVTPAPEGTPDYARLIVDHLPFIEKQCRRAADSSGVYRSTSDVDNEADLLLTEVIDHLKTDDFKVLRDFRGTAKNSPPTVPPSSLMLSLTISAVAKGVPVQPSAPEIWGCLPNSFINWSVVSAILMLTIMFICSFRTKSTPAKISCGRCSIKLREIYRHYCSDSRLAVSGSGSSGRR